MTINQTAGAGAIALNIPTLVAAAFLPALPLLVTAVALAAIGAALGALVGWSYQTPRHAVVELQAANELQRAA
jgi:hypothetical protein